MPGTTFARGTAAAVALSLSLPLTAAAATRVEPGFNLFNAQQDVEIGRQAAREAERQLPVLRDRRSQAYLDGLVRRLAAQAPGARYPYRAKLVDARDVNAFALPGGYMYVNRGLLQAVRTEGELAGVLAHEIAHVALRHGTHQASKAYAAQAGLGIASRLLGRDGGRRNDLVNVVGGLGLNALFLKFSRDMETQADVVGAQIMARAGYDPMEMVSFFEMLRHRHGDRGGFLSDHPAPSDRAARVRHEARMLGAPGRSRDSGGLAGVQSRLAGGQATTRRTGRRR